jgi:transglutaminase-like putative cysteine protease
LSKAINLLDWLSSHTYHVGNYNGKINDNALDLLEYSYDKGLECGINCRALSIILSECCLAIGLKARAIYIMPFSPYDGDNHVVCEVFIPENDKWIMLDPTYNGYIMNEDEEIYNVLELRHALADRANIKFSDKLNYNGDYKVDLNEVKSYYAKDLFYLQCSEIHSYNSQKMDGNRIITFAPVGYDVKKSRLTNIDYRIEKWGSNESMKACKDAVQKDNIIYAGVDILKKAPL